MNQAERLISVIIPVYNGEHYLTETLDSVLAQTYRPIEIIVVDDGSTDHTATIVQSYTDPVRYVGTMHNGTGAARNLGVENSSGEFIAFIDADDLWTPDKLAQQILALDQNPGADIVLGHIRQFISPDLDAATAQKIACPAEPMPGYSASSIFVTRTMFQRVGPFQAELIYGEFMDWYAKAVDLGAAVIVLPQVMTLRRLHLTNLGATRRDLQINYVHIAKAALDRRRKNLGS
jgi:glycosyltransferase involved in cell wall biosynthesis